MSKILPSHDNLILLELMNEGFIESLRSTIESISVHKTKMSSDYGERKQFFVDYFSQDDLQIQKSTNFMDNLVRFLLNFKDSINTGSK